MGEIEECKGRRGVFHAKVLMLAVDWPSNLPFREVSPFITRCLSIRPPFFVIHGLTFQLPAILSLYSTTFIFLPPQVGRINVSLSS